MGKQYDEVPEWVENGTTNPRQVIQRLCKLKSEVFNHLTEAGAADCFCGTGGFWGKGEWPDASYRYDDLSSTVRTSGHESWYRSDGYCIEFIEQAVREKIASSASEQSGQDGQNGGQKEAAEGLKS